MGRRTPKYDSDGSKIKYGHKGETGPTAGRKAETITATFPADIGERSKRVFFGQRALVLEQDEDGREYLSAHADTAEAWEFLRQHRSDERYRSPVELVAEAAPR